MIPHNLCRMQFLSTSLPFIPSLPYAIPINISPLHSFSPIYFLSRPRVLIAVIFLSTNNTPHTFLVHFRNIIYKCILIAAINTVTVGLIVAIVLAVTVTAYYPWRACAARVQ